MATLSRDGIEPAHEREDDNAAQEDREESADAQANAGEDERNVPEVNEEDAQPAHEQVVPTEEEEERKSDDSLSSFDHLFEDDAPIPSPRVSQFPSPPALEAVRQALGAPTSARANSPAEASSADGKEEREAEGHTMDDLEEYEAAFSGAAAEEEIVVGLLTPDQMAQRELALQDARVRDMEQEAGRYAAREALLAEREDVARARVAKEHLLWDRTLRRRGAVAHRQRTEDEEAVRRAYRQAQADLRASLERQKALVEEQHGKLVPGEPAKRRVKVEWERIPRVLRFRLHQVRGAKDKLPAGRFVVLVTLHDRLGGGPLLWSRTDLAPNKKGEDRRPVSRPILHRGRFFDTEMDFHGQSIFVRSPPDPDLRPSHVYILELFQLGGRRSPVDRVVGWTAIPAADGDLRPTAGRFKLPLLRGEVDVNLDRYSHLEDRVARDLDNWLANLYVEVSHEPRRGLDDQGQVHDEFDVEVEYTSQLLRMPGRKAEDLLAGTDGLEDELGQEGGEEEDDGEDKEDVDEADEVEEVPGARTRIRASRLQALDLAGGKTSFAAEPDEDGGDGAAEPLLGPKSTRARDARGRRGSLSTRAERVHRRLSLQDNEPSELGWESDEEAEDSYQGGVRVSSKKVDRETAFEQWAAGGQTSDKGESKEAMDDPLQRRFGGATAGGLPQKKPKLVRHASDSGGTRLREIAHQKHLRSQALHSLVQDSRLGGGGGGQQGSSPAGGWTRFTGAAVEDDTLRSRSALANLGTYSYAVSRQSGIGLSRGRPLRESTRKMQYLWHEMTSDLAPSRAGTLDYWVLLFVLLAALYLRIYTHYLSKWLYLSWLRVPIYEFEPLGYTVMVKYIGSLLPLEIELGSVIAGPMGNLLIFCFFAFVVWCSISFLGHFPHIMSMFVAYFGIGVCLNPLLIFLVDLVAGNYNCRSRGICATDPANPRCECYEGDAFKLYYRSSQDEGSGVVGIILTVFVYSVFFSLAALALYAFLLHLHLDGRLMDLYRRLHGPESHFLVPHDMEVSASELRWIVDRARRWRGARGTQRKVAVCEYDLRDPLDPSFREVTMHLVIYHVGLDGKRELYRHFIRLPEGSILEIFGDLERSFGVQSRALKEVLLRNAEEDGDGSDAVQSFFEGL